MHDLERSQKAKKLLNANGLRSTLQRIKIVMAVETIVIKPFTVDDMTNYLSLQSNRISRVCVYNTLLELVNAGVVSKCSTDSCHLFFNHINKTLN